METLSFEDLSRRVFIKGLGFVSVGLILGTLGGCEQIVEEIKNRPTRRRLRTGSPEVDADIATYKSAVELMQGLSPSDPRTWASIAGIHGTVAGGFLYCQHGTVHFFDWHRAFLFFFEKICQKLTGKANFGLPYWNWNQNPDIHPAFLDSTSALYLPRANTTMAGSWSVSAAALDPIFADTNFYTFSSQLEVTPHNTVHSTIGDTMGTGGSALDPLFWVHHGMVDYSWAKWNIELGNNTTNDPSWANTVDSHFVLIEIVGRKLFHGGLNGAPALQQHLVLIIGLLGGMFAARDRRLLSLSTLTTFLKGRWQTFARAFSSAFAAGITVFLCLAALQLVQSEKGGGKILAYGIPLWTVQLIMPLGFGVIALRLLWHAAATWRGRLVALLLAGSMIWIGFHPPLSPARLVVPGLVALLAAVVLGAPIFVMLGGAALILFWGEDIPIASISLTHYSMVTNPTLPTLPLFTLAGYFLAEGGASKRLIRVFQALLGQFRGGPAIVTVLACAFFSSFR